jgi:hypothetical protein
MRPAVLGLHDAQLAPHRGDDEDGGVGGGERDVELIAVLLGPQLRLVPADREVEGEEPAKNINSLDNQTMVPTATMFGRVAGPCPGMLGTGPAKACSGSPLHSPRAPLCR